mmetsp:Transcript_136746/g.255422  ORF Transcript_136746/g.255422 Transcript_136746/m.255422 type:complete len:201 (+) Transcript_136746:1047-1649(+)
MQRVFAHADINKLLAEYAGHDAPHVALHAGNDRPVLHTAATLSHLPSTSMTRIATSSTASPTPASPVFRQALQTDHEGICSKINSRVEELHADIQIWELVILSLFDWAFKRQPALIAMSHELIGTQHSFPDFRAADHPLVYDGELQEVTVSVFWQACGEVPLHFFPVADDGGLEPRFCLVHDLTDDVGLRRAMKKAVPVS